MKINKSFLSRKFLAATAGVIFAGLAVKYPEAQPIVGYVSAIVLGYIGVQGAVDHKAASARKVEAAEPLKSFFRNFGPDDVVDGEVVEAKVAKAAANKLLDQ